MWLQIVGEDIVKFTKTQRIRLLGHVKRMEEGAMTRKMMERRLFIGRRRKGRPRLRWMDDVVAELKVMKINLHLFPSRCVHVTNLLNCAVFTQHTNNSCKYNWLIKQHVSGLFGHHQA